MYTTIANAAIISTNKSGYFINRCYDAGYVLKNIGKQELITALEKISGGGIYFSDEVLHEMTKASELKKKAMMHTLPQGK